MNVQSRVNTDSLAAFKSYIDAQATLERRHGAALLPAITISRECGAGASPVANFIADTLNSQRINNGSPPWTIFDRNLVERVLAEHELPKEAARFMPEDVTPELRTAFEEFLGLHPSSFALLQFTNETILRLARAGNVIIVGRGGNIVTAGLPNAVHLRFVAPLKYRIREIERQLGLSRKDALEHILKVDRARRRYLKRNFNAKIDDPLAYHLTINTGRMSLEAAARLIAAGMLNLIERLKKE